MGAEPPANSFRAAVLSGRAGGQDPVVRTKQAHGENPSCDLSKVAIPRSESRSGNQRGGDRHRLTAEHALVRLDGRDYVVELINLSGGGAMVRGKFDVKLWDHVSLVLGDKDELDCAVRWLKGDDIGLEFAHETRIDCDSDSRDALLRAVICKSFPEIEFDPLALPEFADPDEPEENYEQRRVVRHPLIWNGTLFNGYATEPVRLRNISPNGALVQAACDFPVGSSVFLDLGASGELEATVRWSRGGQSGLAFAEPYEMQLLARSRPEVASDERPAAIGKEQAKPWAEGWRRSTLDEMARSLGG